MGAADVNSTYHRLRELAFEDPVATKNDFLAILAQDHAMAVAVLTASTDQRGSRFRQITARALGKKALVTDIERAFSGWIEFETDEFALSAIREALAPKKSATPKRQKFVPPLKLESTYKYVSERLRHRVLNALPGAGMAIQRLKLDVQGAASPQLAATLSKQLDQLYGQLSKLEQAVKFDEDSAYFQAGPIELASWLRDHQTKFANEYAAIELFLDFDGVAGLVHVYATAYWLETTFTNLWKNSVDEVGRECCQITLRATRSGNELRIIVLDNGTGFQASDVERAFQFQYSSKSKDRGRGHMEVQDAMERIGGTANVVETDRGFRVQLVFRCLTK